MEKIDWKYGEAFSDGEVVKFAVGTKTYGELWAYVDLSDWSLINDRRWRATRRAKLFYARNSMGGHVLLHRFLMTPAVDMVIDHKDGDGLNNRRDNLRICTQEKNNEYGGDRRRGMPKADWELEKFLQKRASWGKRRENAKSTGA